MTTEHDVANSVADIWSPAVWYHTTTAGVALVIFIWVGQSKAKQILGRPTGVVYVGFMGMTRAV